MSSMKVLFEQRRRECSGGRGLALLRWLTQEPNRTGGRVQILLGR
ncbi:hypothetical protein E2C01_073209 [Portunus trituberculatus]|uniref:Uncharacterized protein n=1 Tax=Portunus trituberculatus TaxID=210409 RepID=A0A5B7I8U0_PORTR|nr:hypothetical protein [Portunus trituberculatus]